MTYVAYIIALLVSFIVGYSAYPALFEFTGERGGNNVHKVTVIREGERMTIEIDACEIIAEELPHEVKLKEPLTLVSKDDSSVKVELAKGASVKLLSYLDGEIEVSDLKRPLKGSVSWLDTDLPSHVGKVRMNKILGLPETSPAMPPSTAKPEQNLAQVTSAGSAETMNETGSTGNAEKKPSLLSEEGGEGEMASSEKSAEDPVAMVPADQVEKESTDEVASTDTPFSAEVEPDAPAENVTLSDEQILVAMKESIESESISEFKLTDVKNWEVNEAETIRGQSYQVGTVSFEKDTILGIQLVKAKCLINNGVVSKWIYASTGTELF